MGGSRKCVCFFKRWVVRGAVFAVALAMSSVLVAIQFEGIGPVGLHGHAFAINGSSWSFNETRLLGIKFHLPQLMQHDMQTPENRVHMWCIDLHVGPAACNAPIYNATGVEFHAEINAPNCVHYEGFCAKRLKLRRHHNPLEYSLDPCPYKRRRDFYEAYKNDTQMMRVDAVICSHPAANCELFLPLNKTLIVYATTRLEFGRFDDNIHWRKPQISERSLLRWQEWISNLQRIVSVPGNVVAANNLYDVEYIKYYTGIKAKYIPSWCDPSVFWKPERPEILIGPGRDNLRDGYKSESDTWRHPILANLSEAAKSSKIVFKRIRELYPNYALRMNVPMFAPSIELNMEWDTKYSVGWERTYGHPPPPLRAFSGKPHPSNASAEWIQLSDFYHFPAVQIFSSWDDLIAKLATTNLAAVSMEMARFNTRQKKMILATWTSIFRDIRRVRGPPSAPHPQSYEGALQSIYGIKPHGLDPEPACN